MKMHLSLHLPGSHPTFWHPESNFSMVLDVLDGVPQFLIVELLYVNFVILKVLLTF